MSEGSTGGNADTAGIVIKSRAISDSIWRQSGATVWTKLIPAPEPFDTQVTGLGRGTGGGRGQLKWRPN